MAHGRPRAPVWLETDEHIQENHVFHAGPRALHSNPEGHCIPCTKNEHCIQIRQNRAFRYKKMSIALESGGTLHSCTLRKHERCTRIWGEHCIHVRYENTSVALESGGTLHSLHKKRALHFNLEELCIPLQKKNASIALEPVGTLRSATKGKTRALHSNPEEHCIPNPQKHKHYVRIRRNIAFLVKTNTNIALQPVPVQLSKPIRNSACGCNNFPSHGMHFYMPSLWLGGGQERPPIKI